MAAFGDFGQSSKTQGVGNCRNFKLSADDDFPPLGGSGGPPANNSAKLFSDESKPVSSHADLQTEWNIPPLNSIMDVKFGWGVSRPLESDRSHVWPALQAAPYAQPARPSLQTSLKPLILLDRRAPRITNETFQNKDSLPRATTPGHFSTSNNHQYQHPCFRAELEEPWRRSPASSRQSRPVSTDDEAEDATPIPKSSNSRRKIEYTKAGETTYVSAACAALLPSLSSEALAPLHIVLPILVSYGKIIVASPAPGTAPTGHAGCDHPLHHYYFRREFPSANNFFSRLYGFCNQSPAWLALDIGYVACREHQVAPVVDLFLSFFRQGFQALAAKSRPSQSPRQQKGKASTNGATPTAPSAVVAETDKRRAMDPVRLRCHSLRLREDQGSNWFLYETPVDACSAKDTANFNAVIRLIEQFNERVREARLCQHAAMKPFVGNKFAIVILKQECSGVPAEEIERMNSFQCEGIEISEVRLVRHKLLDKFGNAMFERDPRFPTSEVYGRPIAHNKAGKHARVVFAKAALPCVITRPVQEVHAVIPELEEETDESDREEGAQEA